MRRPRRTQFRSSEAGGHRNRPWGNASSVREAQDDETIAVCSSPFVDGPRSLGLRFVSIPTPLDDFGLLIGCQQPSSELLEYAPETRSVAFVCRTIGEFELSNDVDGHEGFSHLRFWMSSGRCRWVLIYLTPSARSRRSTTPPPNRSRKNGMTDTSARSRSISGCCVRTASRSPTPGVGCMRTLQPVPTGVNRDSQSA